MSGLRPCRKCGGSFPPDRFERSGNTLRNVCRACTRAQRNGWPIGERRDDPPAPAAPRGSHVVPHLAWTPPQDAVVRELAGRLDAGEIAGEIERRCGVARTGGSVRTRAHRLGLSLWIEHWNGAHVARLLGTTWYGLVRLIDDGLLEARCRPVRQGGRWQITDNALRAFLVGHSHAYDWRRMTPGHPLTALAEVTQRRDPWLTIDDVAALIGQSRTGVFRWMRKGVLTPYTRWGENRTLHVFRASEVERLRAQMGAHAERVLATRRANLAAG